MEGSEMAPKKIMRNATHVFAIVTNWENSFPISQGLVSTILRNSTVRHAVLGFKPELFNQSKEEEINIGLKKALLKVSSHTVIVFNPQVQLCVNEKPPIPGVLYMSRGQKSTFVKILTHMGSPKSWKNPRNLLLFGDFV